MSTEGWPGPMAPSPHPHLLALLGWIGGKRKGTPPPSKPPTKPINTRPLGTPPKTS